MSFGQALGDEMAAIEELQVQERTPVVGGRIMADENRVALLAPSGVERRRDLIELFRGGLLKRIAGVDDPIPATLLGAPRSEFEDGFGNL